MYYVIRNQKLSTWCTTVDGHVESAAASLSWALGKKVEVIVRWAVSKGLHVYVAEHDAAQIIKVEA